jgi:hypothetical protein
LAEKISGVECLVAQGGVVIMRPLVIHLSSKATSEQPRRVLHIVPVDRGDCGRTGVNGRLETKADSSLRSDDMFNHGERVQSSQGLKPRGKARWVMPELKLRLKKLRG